MLLIKFLLIVIVNGLSTYGLNADEGELEWINSASIFVSTTVSTNAD